MTIPPNPNPEQVEAARWRERCLAARMGAEFVPNDARDTCPFCTGASEYVGEPEGIFCERHLRLYRKASAA